MLLIQSITLTWNKSEKGSKCAAVRGSFPSAFPLEGVPDILNNEVLIHDLNYCQDRQEILPSIDVLIRMDAKPEKIREFPFSHKEFIRQQNERNMRIKSRTYKVYDTISDVNVTNLNILQHEDNFIIEFYYDIHKCGQPVRRGHNKDFNNEQSPLHGQDILNEVAFVLGKEQYGRIVYNERLTDIDIGAWYYRQTIINIANIDKSRMAEDYFISNVPDYEYRQIARLF